MIQAPQFWLNGRQLSGTADAKAPVLAPVTLTWGSDSAIEQPGPANLSCTLLFKESMSDVPDLKKGARIELVHPDGYRMIFTGTVRTLSAQPSERFKGGLEVTVNATDYQADLEQEYISTDWPAGTFRPTHLQGAFVESGWWLQMPDSGVPSAQATYNSIKLLTMLDRHISRYRGRRFDSSARNADGVVVRRLTVMEGTARTVVADKLTVSGDGTWGRAYSVPTIGGEPSLLLQLPARNVLRDPSWTQEPDNAITGVVLSTMTQGDDGFTSQVERNYKASPLLVDTYGLQTIDVESDLLNQADQAACAQAWMNSDSPWKMSGITIRDASELPASVLGYLLDNGDRFKTLIVVTDIMPNRPDPGPSDLRSYLLGGTYTWDGKTWSMTLELERTITALADEGDYWTCGRVAASPNPDISNATCETVGDELNVADFRFIGAP